MSLSGQYPYRVGSQDSSTTASAGSNHSSSQTAPSTYSHSAPNETKSPSQLAADGTAIPQERLSLESPNQQDYVNTGSVSEGYFPGQTAIGSMNQTQPYMDMHSSHLSSAQSYAPQGATAGSLPHYQPYQQQPPVIQQGSTTYAPASGTYPSYGYSNGVTSPQSGSQPVSTAMNSQVPAQLLPLPGEILFVSSVMRCLYRVRVIRDYVLT